jgi:von Willebrand factor type A domain
MFKSLKTLAQIATVFLACKVGAQTPTPATAPSTRPSSVIYTYDKFEDRWAAELPVQGLFRLMAVGKSSPSPMQEKLVAVTLTGQAEGAKEIIFLADEKVRVRTQLAEQGFLFIKLAELQRLAEGSVVEAAINSPNGRTEIRLTDAELAGMRQLAAILTGKEKPNPTATSQGAVQSTITFVGVSTDAQRVVFLCDASGSMMTVMSNLKKELNKTISPLTAEQSFDLVFFGGEAKPMIFKPKLVPASSYNKKASQDWIKDMTGSGSTNPIPAIKAAFALRPDVIFVLTDGFDNADSLDEIAIAFRNLNPGHHVKVNTILIKSSQGEELISILQRIAKENGGTFKEVDQRSF